MQNKVIRHKFLEDYVTLKKVPEHCFVIFRSLINRDLTDYELCLCDAFIAECIIRFQLDPLVLLRLGKEHQSLFHEMLDFSSLDGAPLIVTYSDDRYLRIPGDHIDWIDMTTYERINQIPKPLFITSVDIGAIVEYFGCSNEEDNPNERQY